MKNKLKLLGTVAIAVAVGFLAIGCTTTNPIMYTDTANKNFVVLGEVTYNPRENIVTGATNYGLIGFLEAARVQYPDTDYIVDIMVDEKETVFLFWTFKSQIFRGTAIRYVTDAAM
jgi:hypothetical protein